MSAKKKTTKKTPKSKAKKITKAAKPKAKPKKKPSAVAVARYCRLEGHDSKRVPTIVYKNGRRDSRCVEHKREYMRGYMKRRRLDDPTYGEPVWEPKVKQKQKPKQARKAKTRKAT